MTTILEQYDKIDNLQTQLNDIIFDIISFHGDYNGIYNDCYKYHTSLFYELTNLFEDIKNLIICTQKLYIIRLRYLKPAKILFAEIKGSITNINDEIRAINEIINYNIDDFMKKINDWPDNWQYIKSRYNKLFVDSLLYCNEVKKFINILED